MNNKGIFKRLKEGELPLWVSFWIFGVAIPLIFSFLFFIYSENNLAIGHTPKSKRILMYSLMCILYLLYEYNVVVGVWRAAKKYKGRLVWAAGAQFIDLFWGAGMVMTIFQWIAFMALPY